MAGEARADLVCYGVERLAMIVEVIDHKLLDRFHDRVEYARMRRKQGIVVCACGHEIPINEYAQWCANYR